MKRTTTVWITLGLLLASTATAQDLGVPGATHVTTLEGVSEYRLDNGLKVLLFPDESKQSFTFNVMYKVGSVQESYGETGMAHLLEHMMFKGTPSRPKLTDEFTARGAGAGGDANATTSPDRTSYYETLAYTEDNLRWAIEMEADRMVNSKIASEDLPTERTVVRNELEAGENNPIGVLLRQTQAAAFNWHNYGKSTIGIRSDLENVPLQNIVNFYKTYYQPDNAMAVLSGKFDQKAALELIVKSFGSIPKPTRTLPRDYTVEPAQDGERNITVERLGEIQVFISTYHIPAATHPDLPALDLLTSIISNQPSGLLYRNLVESKKALEAGAQISLSKYPDVLMAYVVTDRETSLEEPRNLLLKSLEEYSKTPPSEEELARIKAQAETYYDSLLADAQSVGTTLSEYEAIGDWKLFFWYRDALQKVSVQDIQRVAGKYLKSINRTTGTLKPLSSKPERVEVPAAPSAQDVLKDYQGRAAVQSGEILGTDPIEIEKRVVRGQLSETQKFALLSKKTRGDKVYATIQLHWGDASTLRGRVDAGSFVPELLLKGSDKYTRQQIQDRLTALKTVVSISGSASGLTLSLESDKTHYQEALQFLSEVIRTPTFPEKDFEELKANAIAGLRNSKPEPSTQIGDYLGKLLMPKDAQPGDLFYSETTDETIASIQKLTLQEVKNFYRDFYGASNLDAALLGEVSEDAAKAVLTSFASDWKTPVSYTKIAAPFVATTSTNHSINTPDKPNALFRVMGTFNLSRNDPDAPALTLANYMFGGGFLSSRLINRLRQTEGISYSANSSVSLPLDSQNARFSAGAIFNPSNAKLAEQAFFEELNRVLKDGFTQEELDTARSSYLQSESVGLTDDASLVGVLLSQTVNDRTFQKTAEFYEAIKNLTLEQVNAAFRKYIKPENLIFVRAGEFE
ncbi:M16 family metallopeptidase [Deinococcus cellulosilyticus]|uniref:Peptidase M16 n=1 Tax=Deinococcus cellulosilyticus (strain DSM 18568 / NBRC 106333 / KACC 11606 / 5516J-15) TaxID=1223518 RepID=A0A511MXW2_DEIC1|nr:pitrilysin family protein [Deinococcus cellulosilyticus]GEM45424.1 peptidase M16 [Deinococcus cellulosilyticus NBRC 106333 = KACC 11606]